MARTLVFCPTYRLQPQTMGAIFVQRAEGGVDFLFTQDNPNPPDDTDKRKWWAKENRLHNYQKARQAFLQGGYEFLMIIEDDIIPPRGALARLVQVAEKHGAEAVYGLYLFRAGYELHGQRVCNVFQASTGRNVGMPLTNWPSEYEAAKKQGVIPCSGAGLGCVLFRRPVMETIDFRLVGREVSADCDTYLTRDIHQAGFKMMADMTVACGHVTKSGEVIWP